MTARNAARVLCPNDKGSRLPHCCGAFSELLVGQSFARAQIAICRIRQ